MAEIPPRVPGTVAAATSPAGATRSAERKEQLHRVRANEMRFGSYPLFTLFWPLVVAGELLALLVRWKEGSPDSSVPETAAWIWITILLTTMIATGFDVQRNLAIGWGLLVALCWVIGIYLRDAKHVPVLSFVREYLADLDAFVSPGAMQAVSRLTLLGLIGVLINVYLNHRWRITHNELHLFRRGVGEDAITRGAKRISVEFPDVFELLLLGAGHVVVRDSKGKEEIRRIPRVPFLIFRENQLDEITEAWAVTTTTEATSEDEEG